MIHEITVRTEADGSATFLRDGVDSPPATTQPLKVIVCGGREFDNYELVLVVLWSLNIGVVIQGAARGADTLAAIAARRLGIEMIACPADWKAHPRSAGPIRNREMLKYKPDAVIAFEGGNGTADMVEAADAAGVTVYKMILQEKADNA